MRRQPRPRVRLDWREYYERFKQAHGEAPDYIGVEHEGEKEGRCVLFPDGWRWNMEDRAEIPPPNDSLYRAELRVYYYRTRSANLLVARDRLRTTLEGLRDLQSKYSLPLLERTRFQTTDDEGRNHWANETQELDIQGLEIRLEQADQYLQLTQDRLNEAHQQLEEIRRGTKRATLPPSQAG